MLGQEWDTLCGTKAKPHTSVPLPLQTFQTCRQLPREGAISDPAVRGTKISAEVYNWTERCRALSWASSLPPGARRRSGSPDPSPGPCPLPPAPCPHPPQARSLAASAFFREASHPSGPSRSGGPCVSFSAPPAPSPRPSSPRPSPGSAPRAPGWGSHRSGPFAPGGDRAALFLRSSWAGCRCCLSPQRSVSPFPIFLFLTHFLFYSLSAKTYLFTVFI